MLAVLHEIERALPELLSTTEGWRSLDVTYHPPRVERVLRDHGGRRIHLHVIHPCASNDALFHPHPWPSAVRVLSGNYEMAVGAGAGEAPPPIALTLVAESGLAYEMTHPDGWHRVRPIDAPSCSLMVTDAPWGRWAPRSDAPLRPLPDSRMEEILAIFRTHYPRARSGACG
jgi:hypothetical protein